ncbi:MAG TPA: NADH-quinone oxidoreductase subunit L, partial [Dehalococcoidia bacterium]|nr:NADH-quinone oxidoreductase subunit L [Dehalococcoidia bacterium]
YEVVLVARDAILYTGLLTAFLAATMGLVTSDIKRVLAFSTISQLGFMFVALGVGAVGAAMFHVLTHAFFKALLFLGSGSVIHATGRQEVEYLGGLRHKQPVTAATFI